MDKMQIYRVQVAKDDPLWLVKTMEAKDIKELKKRILKERMKWVPGSFQIEVYKPDAISGPLQQFELVLVSADVVPIRRIREKRYKLIGTTANVALFDELVR